MPVPHDDRIRNAVSSFEESTNRMVTLLEGLNDEAARRSGPDGGWSPAQVGLHVAITNELFAGVLSGSVPMAQPAPAGFAENPGVFSGVPPRLKTPQPLEPPSIGVTRDIALDRLRAAHRATIGAMRSLDAQRASGHVMQLPFGAITLYQAAEFLAPHTERHIAQIHRCTAGV